MHKRGGPGGQAAHNKAAPVSAWRLAVLLPIYGVILVVIGIGAALIHYTLTFPDPSALRSKDQAPLVRILAADGSILATHGKSSDYIPLNLLPRHVINAVVATEDRRFFDHWGVDPFGLIRASFANMRAGRYVQGGSTLTQQLAKNLFLTPERTLSRKFEEVLIALWLEVRLSKREILELYLNRVYFGGGAYGIEAAAQRYFDKSARSVSLDEAAMIAGLLKAPSRYSPRANPGLARKRARTVLRKMHAAGFITKETYLRSKQRSLHFARQRHSKQNRSLQYAIDTIIERLPAAIGNNNGELIVETTIDPALQRIAQRTVSKTLRAEGQAARAGQAALVVLDRRGQIKALIGGRSYSKSQYNRVTTARRQPGSAFKPFVYLAALESGMTPDTIAYDLPVNIDGWQPRNSGGRYRGAVSLRTALASSINTVAARLQQAVGSARVIEVAQRLGIKAKLLNSPSLALGTSEVTLLELTGAYGVFANGGYKVIPHIIRRVKTARGRILYAQRTPANERLVAQENIGAMNDMLNAAITIGTGKRAALAKHPAAGKTGTTQQFRDAWFVGYTAHYVAGVWVGNDSARSMHRMTGGKLPARIWRKVMRAAHKDKPVRPLPGTRVLPPPPPPPPSRAPLMPRQRIGEDFIARMMARERAPAAASDTKYAALSMRSGNEPGAASRGNQRAASAASSGPDSNSASASASASGWWASSVNSVKNILGMSTPQTGSTGARMSLGKRPDKKISLQ